VATLGLSEAERESIERFEAEVINPSMTALIILDFWSDRSTLSNWVGRACWWLTPLYKLLVSTALFCSVTTPLLL